MSLEQNERWKEALMPVALGVIDGFELTHDGLRESMSRLKNRGIPGWSIQLRADCIAMGWAGRESWVPDFALRSETALVGLQLRYVEHEDRVELYRRLFVRFLHIALKPFISRATAHGGIYVPLAELYKITWRYERYGDQRKWMELEDTLKRYYGNKADIEEIQSLPWLAEKLGEGQYMLWLTTECIKEVRPILFQLSDMWWHNYDSKSLTRLVRLFNCQHQWRLLKRKADEPERFTDFTAEAYLAALEGECPAPEWLGGVSG